MVTYSIDFGSAADWISGIGSLAAVVVALGGFKVVARQRAEDARRAEEAVGYDLMAAVHGIGNNVKALRLHVCTARNDIVIRPSGGEPIVYRSLSALIGLSSEGDVQLPAGATQLLVKAKAIPLWNDLLLLASQSRALTTIMKEYRELYQQAMPLFPLARSFTGKIGHIQADDSEFSKVRPSLIQIDSIVGALEEQTAATDELSDRVTQEIGPTLKNYFGGSFLQFGLRQPGPQRVTPNQ
jgi:hypothetical protein